MGQYDEQLKKQAEKRKSGNADYGLYLKKNKNGGYSDSGRGKRKTSEDKAAYQSGEKKASKSKLTSNVDDVLANARFVIDDPTVSFGSLEFDKNAFNRAAEKQKKWWEDTGSTHKTYGYDMSDPEDVLRAQEGRYSKAYEASYGKDELSQWLMANGQASRGYFEQYYNEAAYDIMKEQQKKRNVTALRDGIVNEINATAADPLNPTNEEVTQAALRVKASKAEYADIEIVNPKTSEASYDNYFDPAYAEQQAAEKDTVKREDALYLDDALDYYNKLWDNKKAKDEKAIQAEQSRVTDIIDSAIASSGYDSNINNSANGIAYSADSVNIDRNREAEKNAYLSAVEGLKDKYTDEEIKILLANDGRLTYTQTAKDAEVSAEKQAVIDQRRDAIDTAGNRILGLDYVNENGQKVKKVSHSPEESIVLGVIDKARQFANMGTAAKEGFSPISMSEEWQAEHQLSDEERIVLDGVMATAHEQLAMEGFSDFEIHNYFRRADLGEYIPPEDAVRAALIESGLSQEAVNMVMDSYTDEDFANAQKIALDLAAIDGVDNSFGDQLGYSFASMAATAALKIGGGVVGFADMVSAGMQGREDTWELTKWFDEQADYWTAVGHDSNYKGLSTASEIGSEIIRMMSVAGMGSLAGGVVKGASAAKKGLSWFVKQAAQSIPFVSTAMGGYYNEAMANGATVKEATKYGVIAGATEGILEKIAMGDVIQSHLGSKMFAKNVLNGTGVAKSTFARYGMQLVDILLGAVGEGLEESASYVASGLTRQATWDSSYKLSWGETGESFMGGLILGGLISGLNAPADSQRYKYAMKIMEQTGTFTTDMDSLYAASYFETLPEAQQKVYAEKYNSGEIVADNKTRKEAAKAERELDAINREVITKQQAFEAVKKDAQVKKEKADKKVADMKQRIATLQETNPIKKAKRIGELSQQLGSAQKAQAEVYSEAEKKVKTAENEYTSVLNKQTERTADLEETVLNYQAAKYFNDFYGKSAPTVNTADSGVQTAEPTENTTAPTNTAENLIDTVKTEGVEVVEPVVEETIEVTPEPALKDLGTNTVANSEIDGAALGIVNPELQESVSGAKRAWRKAKQAFISSFAEGERFSKLQSKINKGSVTMEDSAQLLRNAGGTVDYIMEDDLVDLNRKSMGRESYATVMTPPEGIDFDVAQDYLLNLHNIDRMSATEAKAVMANEDGSVRTSEQSKQIVREMEAKYPELANWNAKRRQWWNAFGKEWFVNSGLVSQADWEKWQKAFPNYVPTFRTKYDNGLSSSSIYSTTVDVHGKVKHLVGGTSEVVDIRDGFARYINSIVRATAKNDVVLNLYNFAQQHPNAAAPYAQILDAEGKVSDTVTPDGLADSLDTDAFNEVVKGRYILKGKVDGETVSMAVSKDIYEAVADLFGRTYNPGVETFMNIGKAITTPVKMGITTYNPFFAVRNFLRDTQTAYINDDSINPATFTKSLIDAAVDIHNNSEDFQRFKAYGGDRTGFYSSTAGFVESAGLNADESKIKKWFKQFGKGVSAAGEYTETLNRYATFKRYLDRNGRTDDNYRKAVQAAAEGTTNFSRSGAATKVADAWCLYLNANVQGLDKMARQFTSKDTALKSLGKTAGIAIASVIVKHLTGNDENEHYQNLSNYIKDNNFVIPNYFGEKDDNGYPTSFIVIPKSQGYGAIIAAFERTATMFDEDKEFGEAYDGYLDTLAGALPVNPSTPFSAYKQAIKNESWSGATIEPSRMESEPVTERYDSETSTIAINISELLNRMGVEFSPMKVQYVLEQKTGIVGDVVLPATYVQNYDNYGEEEQKYNAQSAAKSVADPFKNQFVKDPLYSNDIVGNFYDELDEMEQLSKQAKSDRQSAGIDTKSDAEKAYSRWNDMSWWLTDSYKQERAVMASEPNTPKRDEKIRAIRKERVDAVKAFMDNPDTYKIPK